MKRPIYYSSRIVRFKNYLVMLEHHCYDCYTATVAKETPNFKILPALDFCFSIGESNPKLINNQPNYEKAAEMAVELYEEKIEKELKK